MLGNWRRRVAVVVVGAGSRTQDGGRERAVVVTEVLSERSVIEAGQSPEAKTMPRSSVKTDDYAVGMFGGFSQPAIRRLHRLLHINVIDATEYFCQWPNG